MKLVQTGRFTGSVFRAHNPGWSFDPLSGEGARQHGGRFNKRGRPALYTSLSPLTAIREASPFGRPMEPLTLCEYVVDLTEVFDATDPAAMAADGLSQHQLDCPDWEFLMLSRLPVPSQDLAEHLIERGYAAMMVRSYARGAGHDDLNLVFWDWSEKPGHNVRVIDTEQRLPKDRRSWQ